jgi:hypothetical protein
MRYLRQYGASSQHTDQNYIIFPDMTMRTEVMGMDEKRCLLAYLEKACRGNGGSRRELVATMRRLGLSRIFHEELRDLDPAEYTRVSELLAGQRLRNRVILDETIKIAAAARARGVRAVFLKGYYLSADLYDPPEIRKSNDIDVLIDLEDQQSTLEILDQLGYSYADGGNILENLPRAIYDANHYTHIDPVRKRVDIGGKEIALCVDLHVNALYYMPMYGKNDPRSFVYRAVYEERDGHGAWLLEIHDRLVHLIGHFTRHLLKDVHEMLNKRQWGFGVRLCDIHDIALLIGKYRTKIDWDVLIERARLARQCECVSLVACILCSVYPGIVPDAVTSKLLRLIDDESVDQADIRAKMVRIFMEDIDALMFEDQCLLADRLIARARSGCPTVECEFSTSGFNEKLDCIGLTGSFYRRNNKRISDALLTAEEVAVMREYEAYASIWWNYACFNLRLRVERHNRDAESCAARTDVIDSIQSIRMLFDAGRMHNSGSFSESVEFKVAGWQDRTTLRLLKPHAESFLDLSEGEFSVESEADSLSIQLSIPWDMVRIFAYTGKRIGFQIAVFLKANERGNILCLKWAYPNSSERMPIAQEAGEITLL